MTRFVRRTFLSFMLALAASGGAFAQGKSVRILVGFPAGGGTDAIARTLADKLKDELGATVVVENLPWATQAQKYPLLFAGGEEFDGAYAANWMN